MKGPVFFFVVWKIARNFRLSQNCYQARLSALLIFWVPVRTNRCEQAPQAAGQIAVKRAAIQLHNTATISVLIRTWHFVWR